MVVRVYERLTAQKPSLNISKSINTAMLRLAELQKQSNYSLAWLSLVGKQCDRLSEFFTFQLLVLAFHRLKFYVTSQKISLSN